VLGQQDQLRVAEHGRGGDPVGDDGGGRGQRAVLVFQCQADGRADRGSERYLLRPQSHRAGRRPGRGGDRQRLGAEAVGNPAGRCRQRAAGHDP
jgi:hypothetical protein